MSDNSIEILGQKLAYPNSWQGVSAVFCVCVALVIIAWIFTRWVNPEKVLAFTRYASLQEQKVTKLQEANKVLLNQIGELEEQLAESVEDEPSTSADYQAVKSEVTELQKEREALYSDLSDSFAAQDSVVNAIRSEMGDEWESQVIGTQQQQKVQVEQQQRQVQQQQQQQQWSN